MHLIPDTCFENMPEQGWSTFYEYGVNVALGEVAEDKWPIGALVIDNGRRIIGEDLGILGDAVMAVENDAYGVSARPTSGEQRWVVEQGGTCADHDCHILCAHLMHKLFGDGL